MARVNQHHRESLAGNYVGPDNYNDWPISRYGQWRDEKGGPWLVPNCLGGSDYSGTLVERSNTRAWRETFAEGEDEWWCEVSGGHGTFAIVVKVAEMPDDALEFLCALADYPLADDDLHSHMEAEAQDRAWDDWAARAFYRALDGRFREAWEADQAERREALARYGTCPLAIWPEAEGVEAPDPDITNDRMFALFRAGMETGNVYWENEQGGSMHVDIERVVDALDDAEILAAHNATVAEGHKVAA